MDLKIEPVSEGESPLSDYQFDAFARFYDDDYRHYDDDIPLILELAEECSDPILELGCGTGRILLPLAEQGHSLTGVDISPSLLSIAKEKLSQSGQEDRVSLVQGNMQDVALPRKDFAFAYCASNTLMHCATQSAQLAVLGNAFRHLRSGGFLLIDLFNPDLVALAEVANLCEFADRWQTSDGGYVIKWSIRTADAASQLQETLFIYEEIAPDGSTKKTFCPFMLRFIWPSEGELLLEKAGFNVVSIWGDFDGEPYHSASSRLLFLAKKP